MPAPLDRKRLDAFAARLRALDPGARARWGRMQLVGVVAHLAAALRLSLGDIAPPDESTALFRNPVMERFVEALEREPRRISVHPAFGELSLRKWSRLHGKHFDHHLRQFSV